MEIHKKFYDYTEKPTAKNVGQLKAMLEELPDDLPVRGEWTKAVELTVYNLHSNTHLRITDTN